MSSITGRLHQNFRAASCVTLCAEILAHSQDEERNFGTRGLGTYTEEVQDETLLVTHYTFHLSRYLCDVNARSLEESAFTG